MCGLPLVGKTGAPSSSAVQGRDLNQRLDKGLVNPPTEELERVAKLHCMRMQEATCACAGVPDLQCASWPHHPPGATAAKFIL